MYSCAPKKVSVYELPDNVRGAVVKTALELSGRPYKNGGRGPYSFDCSGLVYYAYKKSGVLLPATADRLAKAGAEIPEASVLPGDLVLFKIKGEFHVGIMINRSEFVHSSKSKGVGIDVLNERYWKKSFLNFRRVL
jgi:cell wall-associated NlpC family hydrolase